MAFGRGFGLHRLCPPLPEKLGWILTALGNMRRNPVPPLVWKPFDPWKAPLCCFWDHLHGDTFRVHSPCPTFGLVC